MGLPSLNLPHICSLPVRSSQKGGRKRSQGTESEAGNVEHAVPAAPKMQQGKGVVQAALLPPGGSCHQGYQSPRVAATVFSRLWYCRGGRGGWRGGWVLQGLLQGVWCQLTQMSPTGPRATPQGHTPRLSCHAAMPRCPATLPHRQHAPNPPPHDAAPGPHPPTPTPPTPHHLRVEQLPCRLRPRQAPHPLPVGLLDPWAVLGGALHQAGLAAAGTAVVAGGTGGGGSSVSVTATVLVGGRSPRLAWLQQGEQWWPAPAAAAVYQQQQKRHQQQRRQQQPPFSSSSSSNTRSSSCPHSW